MCIRDSHYAALHDDTAYINTFLAQVRAVTVEEVRAAAARYLQPSSRAEVGYPMAPGPIADGESA